MKKVHGQGYQWLRPNADCPVPEGIEWADAGIVVNIGLDAQFGDGVRIGRGVLIGDSVKLGNGVTISKSVELDFGVVVLSEAKMPPVGKLQGVKYQCEGLPVRQGAMIGMENKITPISSQSDLNESTAM